MEDGQTLYASPYITQIEKFADSLKLLSHTFSRMEGKKKSFTSEELTEMFQQVKTQVCADCPQCSWCWDNNYVRTCQMGYEVLSAIDGYGNELNVEVKRKLQQNCLENEKFLQEMLRAFHEARQTMMWKNRLELSREGCAAQMDTLAEMILCTAKNLEDSLFKDERMEKRMIAVLKKKGIRVLGIYFFMNPEGKFEIHLTARAIKDICITVKEIVKDLSDVTGRSLILDGECMQVLGREYTTIVCMEGPPYYALYGVARIGKGCSKVTGDNFMAAELPGGRFATAISDGMGAGEKACRESTLVIELLEELLEAGFPEKAAIHTINTTLVMGRNEIHYSTVDMTVFDLYTAKCRLIKAGASSTFIKMKNKVEHLNSTSLPIGVLHRLELDSVERELSGGDFVIMVTDGIMDALPVGEQDVIMETIIQGSQIPNPKEMAHHILEQVLNWSGQAPQDDMTVMVVGLWER